MRIVGTQASLEISMAFYQNYAIDIQNLSKSFDAKIAVDYISLRVKEGEIFGFLGPNGSGKTTTIRMLCGLLLPDSGEGQCLGYDIIKQSYAIKQQVGYMPQRFSLYDDLSIYENLDFIARMYQLKNRTEHVEKSLEELGLQDRKQQLAGTLSGGWKQRLALAGAMLHEPKLLLLDEPTAGVDPKARRDFWDQIHLLSQKNITTLVSTHYMDEAERCHRLAYIMQGRILIQGTAGEIVAASKLNAWQVTGQQLTSLMLALQPYKDRLNVAAFGSVLHVSSEDEHFLEEIHQRFTNEAWLWQKILPNLEDIFVSMVDTNKEEMNV